MGCAVTKDEAIALGESNWWADKSYREIATFQLFEDRLCMPWEKFHEAVEKSLGRPVFTHEFAWRDELQKEFLGGKPAPTMEEIMNLIPEHKRLVVVL